MQWQGRAGQGRAEVDNRQYSPILRVKGNDYIPVIELIVDNDQRGFEAHGMK